MASELRSSANGAQVLKRTELIRAVGCLQTTLAQVLGKCKSICTCLPFVFLTLSLLPRGVELPKPEQVGMDAPVIELSCGFCEGIERCRRSQEYAFQPDGKGLDGFGCGTGLSVDLDDVRGVARAAVKQATVPCSNCLTHLTSR